MTATTFYLVFSNDQGLEGSFLTVDDAAAYATELRAIGVPCVRVEIKTVVTTSVPLDETKGVKSC